MSFDLSKLDTADEAEQGTTMDVRHPLTGEVLLTPEGTPVTITLLAEDSTSYRRAQHRAQNRRFSKGSLNKLKAEELENDQLEIYAAVTRAWSGLAFGEEDLPCTRSNALALYRREGFKWLVDQIADFVKDRANFLPSSAKPSPS